MADRSKINGNNSRTQSLSNHPLYYVWWGLMRSSWTLVCEEWTEGYNPGTADKPNRAPKPGLACFVAAVPPRPDPRMKLRIMRGSTDPVFRPGNVEWMYPEGAVPEGTSMFDCECPWGSRWECPCAAGQVTRMGEDAHEFDVRADIDGKPTPRKGRWL